MGGSHRGVAQQRPDDGRDIVVLYQLARRVNRALGGALRICDNRLEHLALENPAIGVDLVDCQLDGVQGRRRGIREWSGDVEQDADLDVLRNCRCRQEQAEAQHSGTSQTTGGTADEA